MNCNDIQKRGEACKRSIGAIKSQQLSTMMQVIKMGELITRIQCPKRSDEEDNNKRERT